MKVYSTSGLDKLKALSEVVGHDQRYLTERHGIPFLSTWWAVGRAKQFLFNLR